MVEFISNYGLFLAKCLTVVASILIVFAVVAVMGNRGQRKHDGHIEIRNINEEYEDVQDAVKAVVLSEDALKAEEKAHKEKEKQEKKAKKKGETETETRSRVYVLDFDGDMKASEVDSMRREITAVLSMASANDEVVVRLESPGGMVHSYGLAASQLKRIRDREIPLTVCVDKVAASGGYMMACVADRIVGAPFAIFGSIGVLAQLPNFHRLLEKNDIDFEMMTAGEYKRTLTMFGKNTDKAREKFAEELEDTHSLFKEFVSEHRPVVDIEKVATGEVWFGQRALNENLIDSIATSDSYIVDKMADHDVYEVSYEKKQNLAEKMGFAMESAFERALTRAITLLGQSRWMS